MLLLSHTLTTLFDNGTHMSRFLFFIGNHNSAVALRD